jgi:hypothetical protein
MRKLSLKKTVFKEIMPSLKKQYADNADVIYKKIQATYNELFSSAQLPTGKHELKYLKKAILPTIATFEITQNMDFTDSFLKDRYEKIAKTYQIYGKIPFFFSFMRLLIKSVVKKSDENDIDWIKDDRDEVAFNITHCYYKDTFKKYGYPALCLTFIIIIYIPFIKNREGVVLK